MGYSERVLVSALIKERQRQGLSQTDVAKLIKCSQSAVSKIECRRDADIRIGDLRRYGCALGFDVRVDFECGPDAV